MSVVESFKAAPSLVKVLAAAFYLPSIYLLVLAIVAAVGADTPAGPAEDTLFAWALLFFGFLFAVIGFLLGKGIARGARGTWLLALVLCGLAIVSVVMTLLGAVTVGSIVNLVIFVGTAALLLTPVVRQHCTKK